MEPAKMNTSVKMPVQNPSIIPPLKLETSSNVTKPVAQTTAFKPHQTTELNLLDKRRLSDLVRRVDPNAQLDEEAEEALLQIADDFIENVVTHSCQLAKHRKSNCLDVKDVLIYLERSYHMFIPGYSGDDIKSVRKAPTAEAHRQRMALIKKTLKKY
ncbi:unnamed protein product [Dimorphilus gyrociliatus]|uniref:Transcription initiation factor TFIID subunit 12 n=1 Tax=Dimorphilus gyrociliatus TaxID=2664684 RepID=A0A7I8VNF0_9ANNE|nr:unnamed protein product [Dimorphilus gyrociliatus]